MSGTTRIRAARLLILRDEGATPHDWLCEAETLLVHLSMGGEATAPDVRYLAALESVYATELAELN